MLTFRTPSEAVEKANNTPYGLSAGVWTEKGSLILKMANELRAGVVWANTFNKFDPTSPFGGYKESGYGREGGRHGLEAYLQRGPTDEPRSTSARPTSSTSAARSRAPSRATPTSSTTRRGRSWPTPPSPRARTPATPSSPPARPSAAGRGKTAYNRAQILYRVAEIMEDRRPQFVEAVRQSEGLTAARATKVVDEAIDRLVWYAGWADKITQVVGGANPVAGPFFNLSTPEPTGVVAVLAPQESSLLGLVSVVAPAIVTGNTVVVVSSYDRPLPAVTFSEVLATSDVPGWRGQHPDRLRRHGRAVAGRPHGRQRHRPDRRRRRRRPRRPRSRRPPPRTSSGYAAPRPPSPTGREDPGLDAMTTFLETKTVWHPIGV